MTSKESRPLSEHGLYAAMKLGHWHRTGHELKATLERLETDLAWEIVRTCCAPKQWGVHNE